MNVDVMLPRHTLVFIDPDLLLLTFVIWQKANEIYPKMAIC